MTRKTSLATVLAATTLLAACGGGDAQVVQSDDQTVAGVVTAGVMSLPVSLEMTDAQPFIVDTGSVMTRVDPNRFPTLGLTPGIDQASTLDVGPIHLTNLQIYVAELCNEMLMCHGSEPAGLLGGTVLVNHRFTIDYQEGTVTFGDYTPPTDVGAPFEVPFVLEGGGQGLVAGQPVSLPATRISVQVDVEGTLLPMIVDTGSSTIVLRPDVYDGLVADGRDQSSVTLGTVMGAQSVPLTTLASVSLAGETRTSLEAVRAPVDLTLLEQEVGHPIAGLLGGRYLQHYITTIDYPARTITLRSYE
jgi:hypothetical protein